MAGQPDEVLAEEPGKKTQRQEERRHDGQLLHDHVEPVGHHGQVSVHRPADQVPVGVHHVGDADGVLVDAAEVNRIGVGQARDRHHAAVEALDHVPLRRDHLADRQDPAFHVEQRAELLLGRVLQDRALQVVDVVVQLRQHREERVDQAVQDQVEQADLGRDLRIAVIADPLEHHGQQRRAPALVQGNDELLGDEAVDLGHLLPVARHAERDDLREVVEVVDPGPQAELHGRRHRQRVEVEGAGQQPRDIVVGPRVVQVEVQPEELTSSQGLLNVLPGGVGVLADLPDNALHSDGAPVLVSRILRHRPDGPGLGFIDLDLSRPALPGRVASRDFWEREKGSEPGLQNTLAMLAPAWSRAGDD